MLSRLRTRYLWNGSVRSGTVLFHCYSTPTAILPILLYYSLYCYTTPTLLYCCYAIQFVVSGAWEGSSQLVVRARKKCPEEKVRDKIRLRRCAAPRCNGDMSINETACLSASDVLWYYYTATIQRFWGHVEMRMSFRGTLMKLRPIRQMSVVWRPCGAPSPSLQQNH